MAYAVISLCCFPVVNCVSLLTRLLPFLFEEQDWRLLFWTPANFLEVSQSFYSLFVLFDIQYMPSSLHTPIHTHTHTHSHTHTLLRLTVVNSLRHWLKSSSTPLLYVIHVYLTVSHNIKSTLHKLGHFHNKLCELCSHFRIFSSALTSQCYHRLKLAQ